MEKTQDQNAFHPGEYIRDELLARGWSQASLALILGWRPSVVQDLLKGTRSISLEMAKALGAAFGTEAQLWINLQTAYQLAVSPKRDETIERKARIFGIYPIREMQTRGWLPDCNDVMILEQKLCRSLGIQSLEDEPDLKHAAKKSDDYSITTPVQQAWLARAKHLASLLNVENPYNDKKHSAMMDELSILKVEPDEIRHIPKILSKFGVRFIVLKGLKKSMIDGACFWIDKNSPCIALSLRYDRIDSFWYCLIHELAHVKYRHGNIVDVRMFGEDSQPTSEKPVEEQLADNFAASFLLDQDSLRSFIARHHPMYSKLHVMAFAMRHEVHPGIVVGQLHHKGKLPYSHLRGLLVDIRKIIATTAFTDGFGHTVSL